MIQGAIEFLLGDSKEARFLRKKCIFKIVPMLNPDGVIYGNYRCSLLGVDLNRRWKHPNPLMHPTIYYTKKLIKIFSEEREVALYCDFHGHSIKKNIFTYACCYKNQNSLKNKQNLLIRLVPYLLSKSNPNFSFESSHFRVEKSKQSTGRVVNFKDHHILTSYTLEASFFGSKSSNIHYSTKDLELIGKDLCSICSVFVSQRLFRVKIQDLTSFLKVPHAERSPSKLTLLKDSKSSKVLNQIKPLEKEKSSENFEDYRESPLFGKDFEEDSENKTFCLNDELEKIPDGEIENLFIEKEEDDSGGSDSQASFNDDKKIKFLMKKKKKLKRKKKRFSESPVKTIQITQISSCSQVKSGSVTPDIIIKNRAKSRNSLRKRSEVTNKQIIPAKIMLRSPFIEENSESRSGSSLAAYHISRSSIFKANKKAKRLSP
jgi:hypothetical protein